MQACDNATDATTRRTGTEGRLATVEGFFFKVCPTISEEGNDLDMAVVAGHPDRGRAVIRPCNVNVYTTVD